MTQTRTETGLFSHKKISRCGFCGSEPVVQEVLRKLPWGGLAGGEGGCFVECPECGARGPHLASPNQSITEWNLVMDRW